MGFDINRLRRSDRIIGISAVAFFVFLFFFKWYGGSATASIGGVNYSASATGWDTFTNSRWIWLLTIGVGLFAVLLRASGHDLEGPVRLGPIVAGLGALSTLLILYRIVHHPSGSSSGTVAGVHFSSSYGIKIGIWLGLLAAAALTYGGCVAMREEGASLRDPLGVRSDAGASTSAFDTAVPGAHEAEADAPSAAPPLPPPVGADDPPVA